MKNAAQMRWLTAHLKWCTVPSKFFTLCLYKASHRHLDSLELERRKRDKWRIWAATIVSLYEPLRLLESIQLSLVCYCWCPVPFWSCNLHRSSLKITWKILNTDITKFWYVNAWTRKARAFGSAHTSGFLEQSCSCSKAQTVHKADSIAKVKSWCLVWFQIITTS